VFGSFNFGVTGSANVLRTDGADIPDSELYVLSAGTILPGGEVEGWVSKSLSVKRTFRGRAA